MQYVTLHNIFLGRFGSLIVHTYMHTYISLQRSDTQGDTVGIVSCIALSNLELRLTTNNSDWLTD